MPIYFLFLCNVVLIQLKTIYQAAGKADDWHRTPKCTTILSNNFFLLSNELLWFRFYSHSTWITLRRDELYYFLREIAPLDAFITILITVLQILRILFPFFNSDFPHIYCNELNVWRIQRHLLKNICQFVVFFLLVAVSVDKS